MNVDFQCEKCGMDMYLEYERNDAKYISKPIGWVTHYDGYAGVEYHTWYTNITCKKCGNVWQISDGD